MEIYQAYNEFQPSSEENAVTPLSIAHRINTVSELRNVPPVYGVEIDLRDYGSDLVL